MPDKRMTLVTGGASGIGKAVVARLAAVPGTVLLADVDAKQAAFTAAELAGSAANVVPIQLDVSRPHDWEQARKAIESHGGHLDGLVHNAGIGSPQSIDEADYETYKRVIAVTQDSVFLGCHALSESLKRAHGSVVTVSSMWGISGGAGTHAAYHAAKGAVRTLSKNLAVAWAGDGVRVNSIHPGWIDTPLIAAADHVVLAQQAPLGRLGRPDEVAAVVEFLLGSGACYITGAEIVVDGGLLAV